MSLFKLRKEKFLTSSGINLKNNYSKKDFDSSLEEPGEYPFTRGVHSTMYRSRFWTMRQYAGFGTAEESNKRYKLLLDKGQTGLSVAFDLPTQMGYDSDHIMSTGEVGKVGVAISSLQDMEILLDDIPLDKVSTSMTINATAGILLALYISVAKKRDIPLIKLSGTIQNDILKEYIARGTYIYPADPSMRIITDIFSYCSESLPNWNTISISGYHIREAGSTAVQEVAFTLANGITYVQAALDKGLNVDTFAKRLSFFFNVHNNFFEEIAKFRAARRMWAKIMKTKFNAKDKKSQMLRFHSQTAGCTLTAQQAENNIARVTIQALASVIGGTQSLHTNSMDEALGLPTEKAATIALRTQQIIAHESFVGDVVDPIAGSYYIESLTDEIEKQAFDLIERIENQGGVIRCIENGWIQTQIQDASYDYQRQVESNEEIVVGVNKFENDNDTDNQVDILKIDQKKADAQIRRLKKYKAGRNQKIVKSELEKLRNCAGGSDNLMPQFISCIENQITLGEISDNLREVFGIYREKITI